MAIDETYGMGISQGIWFLVLCLCGVFIGAPIIAIPLAIFGAFKNSTFSSGWALSVFTVTALHLIWWTFKALFDSLADWSYQTNQHKEYIADQRKREADRIAEAAAIASAKYRQRGEAVLGEIMAEVERNRMAPRLAAQAREARRSELEDYLEVLFSDFILRKFVGRKDGDIGAAYAEFRSKVATDSSLSADDWALLKQTTKSEIKIFLP